MTDQNIQIVDAQWVREHSGDEGLHLVDVRSPIPDLEYGHEYGHIPGAMYLDMQTLFTEINGVPGKMVNHAAGERILGDLGLTRESPVVIYDEGFGPLVAQLAWLLDYYGQESVYILEGGWEAWQQIEGEVSRQAPSPRSSVYRAQVEDEKLAKHDWLAANLDDEDVVILDARTETEYEQGRLPGALHYPYDASMAQASPPILKPVPVLNKMFQDIGLRPDRKVVVYCETGARSAHVYTVLRWLGYRRVRNFEGSWAEWTRSSPLPVEGSAR